MPEIDPIKLANNMQKSEVYFRHLKWQGKRICPKCQHRYVMHHENRYRCKKCRYKFDDFTGTHLAKIKIPANTIVHLLYLFSLGVSAYRIRFYVKVNLKTIEHAFKVFREAIYGSLIIDLRLSGKLERFHRTIDEQIWHWESLSEYVKFYNEKKLHWSPNTDMCETPQMAFDDRMVPEAIRKTNPMWMEEDIND